MPCRNNILLDQYLNAKLGDFDFSQQMPNLIGGKSMITAAVVARSLGYSAPEMDLIWCGELFIFHMYGTHQLQLKHDTRV